MLLFSLLHPRWEFVFQPKYAAYLNLIEPWWKIMRSLVLKGRRFETWAEIAQAVERATAYWNEHKHPFIWGRRRRHRTPRRLGLAAIPSLSRTKRMHQLAGNCRFRRRRILSDRALPSGAGTEARPWTFATGLSARSATPP